MSEKHYYWWDSATQQYDELVADWPRHIAPGQIIPVRNVSDVRWVEQEQEHYITPAERMAKEIVQKAIQGLVYPYPSFQQRANV